MYAYYKVVTNRNMEHANVKEAMRALEKQASAYISLMLSTTEDREKAQEHLATTSVTLQIAERALIADFDQLENYFV